MNYPEALVARFQFLRTPHGDGLDMNEPSYNERVHNHISSYSVKNIEDIASLPENEILRQNMFVVPFLYARYGVVPNDDVREYLRSIIESSDVTGNEFMTYFAENFDAIMDQRVADSPEIKYESNYGQALLGMLVIGTIIGVIAFLIMKILEWII